MKLEREGKAKNHLSSSPVFTITRQFGCLQLPQTFHLPPTCPLPTFHLSASSPSHPNLEFCNYLWLLSLFNSTPTHLPSPAHAPSNASFPLPLHCSCPGQVSDRATSGSTGQPLTSRTTHFHPLQPICITHLAKYL